VTEVLEGTDTIGGFENITGGFKRKEGDFENITDGFENLNHL